MKPTRARMGIGPAGWAWKGSKRLVHQTGLLQAPAPSSDLSEAARPFLLLHGLTPGPPRCDGGGHVAARTVAGGAREGTWGPKPGCGRPVRGAVL